MRRSLFLDPQNDPYSATSFLAGAALKARAFRDYGDKLFSGIINNKKAESQIYPYMQFKQWVKVLPGVGHLSLFRSSEMYLIEAEADCRLGKDDEARRLLVELNAGSGRNPEYTCNKSGDELLDEVRLYNRIELWGEGHDWFNYKRWGLPIVRRSPANGGGFLPVFAGTLSTSVNNGWTWVIPSKEVDYNSDILGSVE